MNHLDFPKDEKLMQVSDDYEKTYTQLLPMYIANSRPSMDTLKTYQILIDKFIRWCHDHKRHSLFTTDDIARYYIHTQFATKNASASTMAVNTIALRTYFEIAYLRKLIEINPFQNIHVAASFHPDEDFFFLQTDQIGDLLKACEEEPDGFTRARSRTMVMLMGIEGLRRVEIHRMNDADIDWTFQKKIRIQGKGHDGYIYPCDDTLQSIQTYQYLRDKLLKEEDVHINHTGGVPLFISLCHRTLGHRISRRGINHIIDTILKRANYKTHGASCHMLRHSCATNLYALTKDLRLIQETLRQSDPKMAARYAHKHDRMTRRYTGGIVPKD